MVIEFSFDNFIWYFQFVEYKKCMVVEFSFSLISFDIVIVENNWRLESQYLDVW